jgi:hypothetical protein
MLGTARRYEMGGGVTPLGVLYLRGYAYLAAEQNKEAAKEFQRIVEHPGIVLDSSIGPLAHLRMGRALAAGGEKALAA